MDAETALLSLMREFVRRIPLVLEVIEAKHPDFLVPWGDLPIQELFDLVSEYRDVPQYGIWTNAEGTWEHFFHGQGCQLTNQITREVIDWDPPDPSCLDLWKFMFWLEWAVKAEPAHLVEAVNAIRGYVQDERKTYAFWKATADALIAQGKLIALDGPNYLRVAESTT